MDLIDRQVAIEAIEKLLLPQINGETAAAEINHIAWLCAINCAKVMIKHLPSAQPERRAGKWIKQNPLVDTEECSLCKYNILSEELETPFCPWCGAEMEERREDAEVH